MTRTEFLEAAKKCICGDRDKQYGSPEDSFQRVANSWVDLIGYAACGGEIAERRKL